ncbi:MAG: hypothetical protein M3Y91_01110 [Actinomycetota bacterium]|nr:hypothetical protein [Actinomycetota bacterium]
MCEVHSTRSAQITAAVGADASYASRSVAARATRDRKAEIPVADLMAGWPAELTAAGHPPADLAAAVTTAGADYRQHTPDLDGLAGELHPRRRGPRQRAGGRSRRRPERPRPSEPLCCVALWRESRRGRDTLG